MYDLVPLVQEVLKDLCKIIFYSLQLTVYQQFKNESQSTFFWPQVQIFSFSPKTDP